MEQLIKDIKAQIAAIEADLEKSLTVKASAARVRKATIQLEKLGKQYRKESLK